MLCHRTNLLKIVFTIVLGTGIFVCLTLNPALLVAQSNSMPYIKQPIFTKGIMLPLLIILRLALGISY